jgi:tubulin polyglutamylase TTLL6/13
MHKPFLIDKLKFDLRIYILLCGVDPLRMYFYKEGLCRLATEEYQPPCQANLNNLFMHLTNYAINKQNEEVQQQLQNDQNSESTGFKRSLNFALNYLRERGHDADKLLETI